MKLTKKISCGLLMLASITFSACNSKTGVRPIDAVYDYNVRNSSTLIESNTSRTSPFSTKVFKLDIEEHMSYWNALDSVATLNEAKITFYDLNIKGTIIATQFEINRSVSQRHHKAALLIPGLQKLVQELDSRGHRYFQIVSPAHISNYLGFPINNIGDLSTYLIPELNNPHDTKMLFSYDMDLINGIATSSLLSDSKTRIIVKVIDKPTSSDIVWDIKKNLEI